MLYGVIPGGGGGGVLNKVLYWEAPSRGETPNRPPPTLLYTIFDRKRDILYLKLQRQNKE